MRGTAQECRNFPSEHDTAGRGGEPKGTEPELVRRNEELFAAYGQMAATEGELRENYREPGDNGQALREARRKLDLLNTLASQEIQTGIVSLAAYPELTQRIHR